MPETVIAMLATTSLGAIWSSCSPDFGVQGVVDRFGQIEPKVLFTADGYGYGGKRFDCLAHAATSLARLPSVEERRRRAVLAASADLTGCPARVAWHDFTAPRRPRAIDFELLPFDHPLYIMYSSGTTGVPKCIVHGAGGTLLQHLKEHRAAHAT